MVTRELQGLYWLGQPSIPLSSKQKTANALFVITTSKVIIRGAGYVFVIINCIHPTPFKWLYSRTYPIVGTDKGLHDLGQTKQRSFFMDKEKKASIE